MIYRLIKHLSEYGALRIMSCFLNALPYRGALFMGWLNAWMGFNIFRFRRKNAISRIRQVFGDRYTRREIRNIAWQSWRNIVFNAMEMMRLSKVTLHWAQSECDCEQYISVLKKHCESGKGAIVAAPHMGSWDLAAVISHLHGIPVFVIAAQQKNPLVDAYLNELRAQTGIETIPRGSGTMKQVMKKLDAGGVLAILPDVRMRSQGIQTPFLGGQANLGKGMALFARHADIPIFPIIVTRTGWHRHKIDIFDSIQPNKSLDKEEDVSRMTASVMNILEQEIRRKPEQWFWFNKRWVLDPFEAPDKQLENHQNSRGKTQ